MHAVLLHERLVVAEDMPRVDQDVPAVRELVGGGREGHQPDLKSVVELRHLVGDRQPCERQAFVESPVEDRVHKVEEGDRIVVDLDAQVPEHVL